MAGTKEMGTGRAADGFSRRGFIKACAAAAVAIGLPAGAGKLFAEEIAAGRKPSVIWLHFQECTGCTESLLRSSAPDVGELILDLISLDYHETLFAAAGHQIEAALHTAMEENRGKYILVVEGAIPTKLDGIFCKVAGKTAVQSLQECAENAGAIIALGSCASWGGIPSAEPNPTGATGVPQILKDKTVVTLPGCPANPYNLLGIVLQYATFGTLPALDEKGRPKFAYARTIHEDCPRRPHFDAGRFAEAYGDAGHNEGYCLYKLGCKGPATHANCSLNPFCEMPGAWPVGIGHPCYGCTEQGIGFHAPLHATIDVEHPTAPGTYPPLRAEGGTVSPLAVGVAGALGGLVVGAGAVAAKKLSREQVGEKEVK